MTIRILQDTILVSILIKYLYQLVAKEFTMTKIYNVVDLTDVYGSPSYGVEHIHEGIVSVWTDWEFATDVAEDLEWSGQ